MLFTTVNSLQLLMLVVLVESGFIIGLAAMAIANRRVNTLERGTRWLKFGWYFIIVHVVLAIACFGKPWITIAIAIIVVIGAIELISVSRSSKNSKPCLPGFITMFLIYSGLAIGSICFSWCASVATVVYVYVVISVLDAYSQLAGQLFGRHLLLPNISPKKTVEGAIGGVVMALAASILLGGMAGFTLQERLITGIVLCGAGIAGDLTASWYKRIVGVKDYSRILPGQGGILDRFNSTITAMALFLILHKFF